MKSRGFSPKEYILVLPVSIKPEGVEIPEYVRFSPHTEKGTGYFLRRADLGIPGFPDLMKV